MREDKFVYWARISAQILFYLISALIIIQVIRMLLGGSWTVENVILAFVIANLTLTVTLMGAIYKVNNKIPGHIGWHRGFSDGRITKKYKKY